MPNTHSQQTGVRSYMSGTFRDAALRFRDEARSQEKTSDGLSNASAQRIFAASGIVAAVCFLESVVNDVYLDCVSGWPPEGIDDSAAQNFADFWNRTEEAGRFVSILKKYQRALDAAGRTRFEESESVYENADTAVKIRNGLTHFKSYMYNSSKPHPLDDLIGRIDPPLNNPLRDPRPLDHSDDVPGPSRILCSDAVTWVLNSCDKFVDEWHGRMRLNAIWWRVSDPEY